MSRRQRLLWPWRWWFERFGQLFPLPMRFFRRDRRQIRLFVLPCRQRRLRLLMHKSVPLPVLHTLRRSGVNAHCADAVDGDVVLIVVPDPASRCGSQSGRNRTICRQSKKTRCVYVCQPVLPVGQGIGFGRKSTISSAFSHAATTCCWFCRRHH